MPRRAKAIGAGERVRAAAAGVFGGAAGGTRFTLDSRQPAAAQIGEVLRDLILSLRLEPGTALSRDEIARAFGVSPMPVRDALRWLEGQGLVTIRPQSGTRVTRIDVQLSKEAQFLRIGVEIEVARTVAEKRSESDIRELSNILRHQRLELNAGNLEEFTRIDSAFHEAMYRMAGVAGLWRRIQAMRVHIDRLRRMHLLVGGKMTRILADHEAILDAIRAQDLGRAEAAVRKHLSDTLSAIERLRSQYPHYF